MAGTTVHIIDDTDLQEVWETAFQVRITSGKAIVGRKSIDAVLERDKVRYLVTVNYRQVNECHTLAEATDEYNKW